MRVFSALLSVSGVSPAQAAKSRPVLKRFGSPIAVTTACAVSGPTPGICISRRIRSSLPARDEARLEFVDARLQGAPLLDQRLQRGQRRPRNDGIASRDLVGQRREAAQAGAGDNAELGQ